MTNQSDLWETHDLLSGLTLELRAGDDPALALVQSENRVRVNLSYLKGLSQPWLMQR